MLTPAYRRLTWPAVPTSLRLVPTLTLVALLAGCAGLPAAEQADGGSSAPVGPAAGPAPAGPAAAAPTAGDEAAATGGIEAAVVVDEGYELDVISQEYEYTYGQYLLFSDGSVLDHLPAAAPADFDAAASRAAEPTSWGTWQIDGDQLILTWNGQESTPYDSWFRLDTMAAGETLDAAYSAIDTVSQGGGSGSSFFASGWQQLVLTADGAFARTAGGSVESSSELGQVVSGSTASERGRYRFDGPLLELAFDDGHTERAGAFFTGDDRQTLLLNGVSFQRDL